MNETGCAYVCFLYATICAILSWHALKTGDSEVMVLVCALALVVLLLAALVLICRYAP